MTPEQEAKLTMFLDTAQVQSTKMDGLLAGLNQLVPQVRDNKSDVRYLRGEVQKIHVTDSRQSEQIKNVQGDVDAVGKKVRAHVGNASLHRSSGDAFTDASIRWVFIAKVSGGLAALAALLVTLAKFVPHH